jgi:hypothetical protein
MWETTILASLGTYSEVAKKSMPSPHAQQIREHFDTTLLEGKHKPTCSEAILWDPDISKYYLLCNELQTA